MNTVFNNFAAKRNIIRINKFYYAAVYSEILLTEVYIEIMKHFL